MQSYAYLLIDEKSNTAAAVDPYDRKFTIPTNQSSNQLICFPPHSEEGDCRRGEGRCKARQASYHYSSRKLCP